MSYGTAVVVSASSAKTTTGQSSTTACEVGAKLAVWVNVSAVSGTTPTLDLSVQWSQDGGTAWADAEATDSFNQITAPKVVAKTFDRKGDHFRLRWVIAGTTPSFTFEARSQAQGGT